MLRLSRLTDYAVVALVRLGRTEGVETTPGIAASIGIPEPTVAKVLKALTNAGLVISQRGAHGGYRLARPLRQIPVADVIVAIDGPIALTSCVDGAAGCESQSVCPVAGRWDPVNTAIRDALTAITLADMEDAAVPRAFRRPAAKSSKAGPLTASLPTASPPTASLTVELPIMHAVSALAQFE